MITALWILILMKPYGDSAEVYYSKAECVAAKREFVKDYPRDEMDPHHMLAEARCVKVELK